MKFGAAREKIVVGVALHGNVFKLSNSNKNSDGNAHKGYGHVGPYVTSRRTWTYLEVGNATLKRTITKFGSVEPLRTYITRFRFEWGLAKMQGYFNCMGYFNFVS